MNIGIVVPSLDVSQLSFHVVGSINHEIASGSKNDFTIFFEQLTPRSMEPRCAVMSTSELWSFRGLLLTTTFSNTRLSSRILGDITRVFLMQDLEWLRHEKQYLANLALLRNPSLYIAVRSTSHGKALEEYCGRKPNYIMPQFNFSELANEFQRNQNS